MSKFTAVMIYSQNLSDESSDQVVVLAGNRRTHVVTAMAEQLGLCHAVAHVWDNGAAAEAEAAVRALVAEQRAQAAALGAGVNYDADL